MIWYGELDLAPGPIVCYLFFFFFFFEYGVTCRFLECGRNLECPVKSQASTKRTCKRHTRRNSKLDSCALWGRCAQPVFHRAVKVTIIAWNKQEAILCSRLDHNIAGGCQRCAMKSIAQLRMNPIFTWQTQVKWFPPWKYIPYFLMSQLHYVNER